jgi:hypothetical protein
MHSMKPMKKVRISMMEVFIDGDNSNIEEV